MVKLHQIGRTLALLLVTALLASAFAPGLHIGQTASAAPQEDGFIYLPLVMSNYPQETIFGAALNQLTPLGGFDLMAQAESSWTRITLPWNVVEPSPGQRQWSALAAFEQGLSNANSRNMEVVLVIEDTPAWAVKPGYSCNIVAENHLAEAARFASDVAARYSQSPFNVKYFELWNEPDAYDTLGCWGDPNDEYFGGRYYGQMLQTAYPAVKAASPSAQVLVGGLLMDCTPENTPGNCDGKTGRFMEGILVSGAANAFDGVSFHAYDYYLNPGYGNANWNASWSTTGPSGAIKAGYLRRLLVQYEVTGKYLMNTETALLCSTEGVLDAVCQSPEYEAAKSAYLLQSYAGAYADQLRANIWYSVPGWRNSGLIDMNTLTPRPAYHAFKTARQMLGGSTLTGQSINPAGLSRFDFTRSGKRIAVMWSNGAAQPLPAGAAAVYDLYGVSIPLTDATTIARQPVYVEFGS